MAHEISNIDKQQGIEQAWHGLTEVHEVIDINNNFLTSWDVESVPLYINNGKPTKLPYSIFRCTDDKSITIGEPFAGTYIPIKNSQFLEIIRDVIAGNGFTVSSIGSVCKRSKIFASVKLAEMEEFTVGNRTFKNYLNFLSSHDGSTPFYVNTSNICTVCNNTFTANLQEKQNGDNLSIKIKHTKNSVSKLDNIADIVDSAIGVAAEFKAAMETWEEIPVNAETAKRIYTGFVVPKSQEVSSTRSKNNISRMVELFHSGKGNKGENLSDVFNGLTDFYTHESAGDNRVKQYVSSEFADAMYKKQEFFSALSDNWEGLEKRGQMIVNNDLAMA